MGLPVNVPVKGSSTPAQSDLILPQNSVDCLFLYFVTLRVYLLHKIFMLSDSSGILWLQKVCCLVFLSSPPRFSLTSSIYFLFSSFVSYSIYFPFLPHVLVYKVHNDLTLALFSHFTASHFCPCSPSSSQASFLSDF